jgi:serine/threonine protein kinase
VCIYLLTPELGNKTWRAYMEGVHICRVHIWRVDCINKLTWKMKLQLLYGIAYTLQQIHRNRLVHCDIHGGNIVLHNSNPAELLSTPFICDLGLSCSTESESNSDIRGVLPFIAPEVFSTRKFTYASAIYAFGIIVYLVATGEPPFRDRSFDKDLVCDILGGLDQRCLIQHQTSTKTCRVVL